MNILAAVSLTNMVSQRFFADAEHESEAKFESLWVQEVAFATDDETTSADKHTRRWSL